MRTWGISSLFSCESLFLQIHRERKGGKAVHASESDNGSDGRRNGQNFSPAVISLCSFPQSEYIRRRNAHKKLSSAQTLSVTFPLDFSLMLPRLTVVWLPPFPIFPRFPNRWPKQRGMNPDRTEQLTSRFRTDGRGGRKRPDFPIQIPLSYVASACCNG